MTIFVPRSEWGARPRVPGASNNLVAHPEITIHYEGEGWVWPWAHSTCDDKVRAMQAYHMDKRGWSDIAYTELACPHNYVFEGRGYNHQSSANGYESANEQSHALQAMWGSKAGTTVPDDLKRALLWGIDYLVDHGAERVIKGHRDWKQTDCPGDELYAWIQAGCPSPDQITPPKDTVVATLDKEDLTNIERIVQRYSAFNAENLRQRIDDIANAAARAVDATLADDFTGVETAVAAAKAELDKLTPQS